MGDHIGQIIDREVARIDGKCMQQKKPTFTEQVENSIGDEEEAATSVNS